MRKLSLALLVAALFAAIACSEGGRGGGGVNPGDKAPNIEGADLGAQRLSLWDIKGKAYLVNFWATWCPPCVAELPELQALHERFKDQGLQVIGVAVDDVPEEVSKLQAQYKLTYPILLDHTASSRRSYQLKGLPESFILDRTFKITMVPDPENTLPVTRIIGPREWNATAITQTIEALLKDK